MIELIFNELKSEKLFKLKSVCAIFFFSEQFFSSFDCVCVCEVKVDEFGPIVGQSSSQQNFFNLNIINTEK